MRRTAAAEVVSRTQAIFAVALVVSAGLHGAVFVNLFARSEAGLVVGALTTGGLTWAALRSSLRAKRPAQAWPLRALLAGVCNSWVAWLILDFTTDLPAPFADASLGAVLIGGTIVGGVLAIPFALMGWLLVVAAARAAHGPSLDRPWRAALIAGVWTTFSALLSLDGAPQVAPVTMIVGALGVAAMIVGALVLGARVLWLARVRRGAVPGWVVVTAAELRPPGVVLASELLPWSSADPGNAVLARERRAGAGAYREGSTRELVAWV